MKKKIACSIVVGLFLSAGSIAATPLTPIQHLGKMIFKDNNISLNRTQSCATCHLQTAGFADPENTHDPFNSFVSLGDDGTSRGDRNSPTAAYGGFSPIQYQSDDGDYYGGMFWDGRATGDTIVASGAVLGDPLAEQAQGPPLNPVEMHMGNIDAVVDRLKNARYVGLFLNVFGEDIFTSPEETFDAMAKAVASYERSTEVNPFNSRYDRGELNAQEQNGLALVEANCVLCHSMDIPEGGPGPVFTSYGYENIGVPVNEALLNVPGTVYSPPDLGLGGFLGDPEQDGKLKIPTLRNVAMTAPYSHNGFFPTLQDIVAFHNSREGWPEPEVGDNVSYKVGEMGLNGQNIKDIIAFLYALTDQRNRNNGRR